MEKKFIRKQNREKEIYQFFLDYFLKEKNAPTYAEIAKNFGITRERVRQLLAKLEKQGYLVKTRNYHRPYTINPAIIINLKGQNNEQNKI